jgi:hypothetical protein
MSATAVILRRHGVLELFNKLNRLKTEAKDMLVVLGRPHQEVSR